MGPPAAAGGDQMENTGMPGNFSCQAAVMAEETSRSSVCMVPAATTAVNAMKATASVPNANRVLVNAGNGDRKRSSGP